MNLEIITPFVVVISLIVAWFLFESINKKTNFFVKWHWSLICGLPFLLFGIFAAPMIAANLNYLIVIIGAGSVLAFGFGFAVSTITTKYKKKSDEKQEQIKETTIFGYKNNKENIKSQKGKLC